MSAKDDGGPAFPVPENEYQHYQPGMTMRDWFAGQALAGLHEAYDMNAPVEFKTLAVWAYSQADIMLAERAKP